MDKWEYKTEEYYITNQAELDDRLNVEGLQGWEAVSIRYVRDSSKEVTFKRKVTKT